MKIYLAGPFFNDVERKNIEMARDILRDRGYKLFVPMEHKIPDGENMPNNVWGQKVFEMDREAIFDCDIVVALYYGLYSDSGTAWEIGFANCLHKKIVIVHCDKKQESSLMIVNGSSLNVKGIEDLRNLDFMDLNCSQRFYSHTQQK